MKRIKFCLAILLSFALLFSGFPLGIGVNEVEAAPVVGGLPTEKVFYDANAGPVKFAPNLTIDAGPDEIFADGYLLYEIEGGSLPEEILALAEGETIITPSGEVSVSGTSILLDGEQIGSVDTTLNGIGEALQINFATPLPNGDFEQPGDGGEVPGWTIDSSGQIWLHELATKTQGRAYSSVVENVYDDTYTVSSYVYEGEPVYTYVTDVPYGVTGQSREGTESELEPGRLGGGLGGISNGALELGYTSGNINAPGNGSYGTAFRAEAWSDPFTASAGDRLVFDWSAEGGQDDYEVYGFLVDEDGNHTELMYGRGKNQPWITSGDVIPFDGEFQFRFVAGSYDQTGGYALGAKLYIDNVRVLSSAITSEVVEAVAGLVTYEHTNALNSPPDPVQRNITITAANSDGETNGIEDVVTVVVEPQLELIHAVVEDDSPDEMVLTFNLPVGEDVNDLELDGLVINGQLIESVLSVDGDQVIVKLAEAVAPGETLTLEYDAGEDNVQSANEPDNKLQSIGSGDLDSDQLINHVVPLELIHVDTDVIVSPNEATLVFNKPVDVSGLTVGEPIPGFEIGGKPVLFQGVNPDNPNAIETTIDGDLEPSDTVDYDGAEGAFVADGNPNNLLGNVDGDDSDNQPATTYEEDQLILVSAKVEDSTPDMVALTFNRPIDGDSLDLSGFTFNGYEVDSDYPAEVNGDEVLLKLVQPLAAGDLVVTYDDDGDAHVGSAFNPDTNLLQDITADQADQDAIKTKDNGVTPLELIKVSTDPSNSAQLKLKFNKSIAKEGLTPGEAIAGFEVGDGKPVTFVGMSEDGTEMIVSLEEPYLAGDQLSYVKNPGDITDAGNPNNKLNDLDATDLPMVSGKLSDFGLSSGGEELKLSPSFNPNNNDGEGDGYKAVVPNATTSVSIHPIAYNPDDTVTTVSLNGTEVDGTDGGWDNIGELQEGPNEITVKVYDKEDPSIVLEEYTIIVVRATAKLGSLVPSEGTLDPKFTEEEESYEIRVANRVSELQLTPTTIDPGATIRMTVNDEDPISVENGMASDDLSLKTGVNTIVVEVTDSKGEIKEYTLTVRRASAPVVFFPPNNTETITVDVVIGGESEADITKVDIERTVHNDHRITDQVTFTPEKAEETVNKAVTAGENLARMVIPDPNDEVTELNVNIPRESLEILRENNIELEIYSDHGMIRLPRSSMDNLDEDFYFKLIPVRDLDERSEVEERARTEEIVREKAGEDQVNVVTRPMTIETNLSSRPVTLILPLSDVQLPGDAEEREAYLDELHIFIEHSDGEKALVKGTPVTMPNGEFGLEFRITKFSTFTIIHLASEKVEADGFHSHYINGYPDGTFLPENSVTRAEMATMLANVGITSEATGEGYPDVADSHWAADAISRAQASGLMSGYPDGTFQAGKGITRAEMATLMFQYLELSESGEKSYSDVDSDHWAFDYIEALTAAGWMSGYPDGTFQPSQELTRAEAVTLINRLVERGPLNDVPHGTWPDVTSSHWAYGDIEEASRDHSYIHRSAGGEILVSP